ncbi:MAG TPA: DNA ligase D [Candidatus Angelobacter sp.]|nr:DNA ligase D [Candidatus Angelobacter sp.]
MSLEEYRRKRVFTKTPEPPPAVEQGKDNRFFIQRHSATRLHYDLRLEMDGVLKSWALPSGPTLDPKIKRLAVHVEDHPLDYGNFEGTIPAGNYGAGKVILWDRGTYELLGDKSRDEQWKAGDLKLRFHGQKLLGDFALVRTKRTVGSGAKKKEEWLLIKKQDFAVRPGWNPEDDIRSVLQATEDLATIEGAEKAAMPVKLEPMLAVLGDKLPSGTDWLYEVKWDGYRALCFLSGGKLRMVSRRGNNMDKQFPEVCEALLAAVKAETAIVDGEVVAVDENGIPSFQLLQNRTGFRKAVNTGVKAQALGFFAFDLIYLNGYDLRKAALIDRRRLLQSILLPSNTVRYSDHFAGKGEELLEAVRARGLEGIVAKRADSRYESRRTSTWIKLKVTNQQDFVVCGFIEGEREYFGALVLGYYREDDKKKKELVYAGNVGSGFTQQSLKSVHESLQPLITKKPTLSDVPKEIGQVTWVKPELVCVVKFNSWTDDMRLRAPVFQGMRMDASPEDTVPEVPQRLSDDAAAETASSANSPAKIRSEPLLAADAAEVTLNIGGHSLKFTNLKKVFYPADGYTKRDVINFYAAVADLLVPHLQGRPLSLKRYPNGINADFFFQKDTTSHFPEWLHTELIPTTEKKKAKMAIADDKASLLYLANLGCIDQNPWMSRVGSLDCPDFILIDLDPYYAGYDRIIEAAQLVKGKLDLIGLKGYPKTTGGDGMHIYIPLEPQYTYAQARTFAEVLARWIIAERPELFTTPRNVAARQKGKVYFDYLQIAEGKTISAPYVVRAYPGAPVATPLSWDEVRPGLKPQQFHIGNVLRRFERVGDLFEDVLKKPQQMEKALEKLSGVMASK